MTERLHLRSANRAVRCSVPVLWAVIGSEAYFLVDAGLALSRPDGDSLPSALSAPSSRVTLALLLALWICLAVFCSQVSAASQQKDVRRSRSPLAWWGVILWFVLPFLAYRDAIRDSSALLQRPRAEGIPSVFSWWWTASVLKSAYVLLYAAAAPDDLSTTLDVVTSLAWGGSGIATAVLGLLVWRRVARDTEVWRQPAVSASSGR